jgi:hypothetical protein
MAELPVDMVEVLAVAAVFPIEPDGKPSAGAMGLKVGLLRLPGGDSMRGFITATFGMAMIGSWLGLEPDFMTGRGTGTIVTMIRTMVTMRAILATNSASAVAVQKELTEGN